MPFAYVGAKHGLAAKYPAPVFPTIIEPFAGSAGYSVHHRTRAHRVILRDADPAVIELWHELQHLTGDRLLAADRALLDTRVTDRLILLLSGGETVMRTLNGRDLTVTSRMRKDWTGVRKRIVAAAPYIATWNIEQGDYRDVPNIEATWFIDPPYQSTDHVAGMMYREGSDQLDYEQLAAWCRTRRGQVIVCEQTPAAWLPFTPLARQQTAGSARAAGLSTRTELIYHQLNAHARQLTNNRTPRHPT